MGTPIKEGQIPKEKVAKNGSTHGYRGFAALYRARYIGGSNSLGANQAPKE